MAINFNKWIFAKNKENYNIYEITNKTMAIWIKCNFAIIIFVVITIIIINFFFKNLEIKYLIRIEFVCYKGWIFSYYLLDNTGLNNLRTFRVLFNFQTTSGWPII